MRCYAAGERGSHGVTHMGSRDAGFKVVNALPGDAKLLTPTSSAASISNATTPSPVRPAASLTASAWSGGFAADFEDTAGSLRGPGDSNESLQGPSGSGPVSTELPKPTDSWAAF